MEIVFVTPPPIKPSEPGLSAGAAAGVLRRHGAAARSFDASLGWHRFALAPHRLEAALAALAVAGRPPGELLAARRAIRHLHGSEMPLARAATYRSRRVYTSAINHLENALRLVAAPFAGFQLRIAHVAVERPGLRPESSAGLAELAETSGPFDDYFLHELIPQLAASGAGTIGVSLTFQQQAPAAFRLARLLREHLPGTTRLLGGPLPACWQAVGVGFERAPFSLFHRVVPGSEEELRALAASLIGRAAAPAAASASAAPPGGPLALALDEAEWPHYLAPVPTVPAALGRGCYWRRCTFCPDHLHRRQRPCDEGALADFLHAVAARFPAGAMLHLTDSALPPGHLAHLAEVIRSDALPLAWHGFVRVEEEFADPDFARHLAAGGCAMLQLGVESAAPRLLAQLGKGAGPDLARRVLRALAAAGIRNHVYLLFGVPGETDADREQTLAFVEEQAGAIHAINHALLNLPRGSPMHRRPERFGITEIVPFHTDTDLSLYDDFRCGASHPRTEARRWLDHRFFKSEPVRRIFSDLRSPFKANHLCFL